MYPNYRTTAAARRDKPAMGCLYASIGILAITVAGAYFSLAYVLVHFIVRYW